MSDSPYHSKYLVVRTSRLKHRTESIPRIGGDISTLDKRMPTAE